MAAAGCMAADPKHMLLRAFTLVRVARPDFRFRHPETAGPRDSRGNPLVSNRIPSQFTDSTLLRHYVADGNEAAFGELVVRYQNLVLGAAYRKSGDLELARDVAQQVFAALARKATLLTDRDSLAGWLHQAAMFETYRALQAESRRRARQDLFVLEEPVPSLGSSRETSEWAVLDEEIDRLPFADREAIALHYFQDLSYTEMAAVLGANEAAVRKRVSRALQRLGESLRERGVKQTAAALLAGALALQNSITAPAGLAQAALALAAAGGGASAFLTLTAVMSNALVKTAAMIAGAAIIYSGWKVLAPHHDSAQNEAGLAATQPVAEQGMRAVAATVPVGASQNATAPDPGVPAPIAVQALPPAIRANPVQALSAVAPAADARRATLSPEQRSEIAQNIGRRLSPTAASRTPLMPSRFLPAAASPVVRIDPSQPSPDLVLALDRDPLELGGADLIVSNLLSETPDLPQLLRELELLPSEVAEFYSSVLGEALALTPVESSKVKQVLERHFVERALAGLAGPRPENIAEPEWVENRTAIVSDAVTKVVEATPVAAAAPDLVEAVLRLPDHDPAAEVTGVADTLLSTAAELSSGIAVPSSGVAPAYTPESVSTLPVVGGLLPAK